MSSSQALNSLPSARPALQRPSLLSGAMPTQQPQVAPQAAPALQSGAAQSVGGFAQRGPFTPPPQQTGSASRVSAPTTPSGMPAPRVQMGMQPTQASTIAPGVMPGVAGAAPRGLAGQAQGAPAGKFAVTPNPNRPEPPNATAAMLQQAYQQMMGAEDASLSNRLTGINNQMGANQSRAASIAGLMGSGVGANLLNGQRQALMQGMQLGDTARADSAKTKAGYGIDMLKQQLADQYRTGDQEFEREMQNDQQTHDMQLAYFNEFGTFPDGTSGTPGSSSGGVYDNQGKLGGSAGQLSSMDRTEYSDFLSRLGDISFGMGSKFDDPVKAEVSTLQKQFESGSITYDEFVRRAKKMLGE